MSMIKVEEDVFIRDQYGVRVRVFVAGSEVEEAKYNAVVKPEAEKPKVKEAIENKMIPEPEMEQEAEIEEALVEEKELTKEKKPAKAVAKAKK